jgi:hypothetical protein
VAQVLGLTKTSAMQPHNKSLQPTPLRNPQIDPAEVEIPIEKIEQNKLEER